MRSCLGLYAVVVACLVALLLVSGFVSVGEDTPTVTLPPGPAPTSTSQPTPRPAPTHHLEPASTARAAPTPAAAVPVRSTATAVPRGPAAVTIGIVPVKTKIVALTFDAGADRGYAPQLLALLERDNIKATFGVTGRWAESNPDLIRQMVADGQEIMNHTYDHRSFTGRSAHPPVLTEQGRIEEIQRTESIVRTLTGVSLRPLFRPPYGDQDASVLRDVGAAGYRYSVLWTVDSGGWKGYSTQQIIEICLKGARPGAIYVFHVDSASHDVEAMPAIIDGLRRRGYSFATIGALLHLPPQTRSH